MNERIVMVGAGYWAQFQVEGWRDAGAPLVAIGNRHIENAQALAQRYGVPRCYSDIATMLDAERPTLVDVVLPPVAQEAAVRAAIERGIPTICQKPFGANLEQAEAMTALAEAAGVPLVVHENFRFAPWFREMRRCIDAGFFGRVHGIAFRLRPGDGQGPQAYLDRQPYFQQMPRVPGARDGGALHRHLPLPDGRGACRHRAAAPPEPGDRRRGCRHLIFEFDDERTGPVRRQPLNDHRPQPAPHDGRDVARRRRGVMRLDGHAQLWWKPHQGTETCHDYDDGTGRGAFGGACTALQAHVLAHLRQGTALENGARDYLANLHVQAAVYHSHASGRRVPMAGFDPHHP
jgi:hypothetical protein